MYITLLGHATLLVQSAQTTCLVDPVFSDPFEDGAVESCPSRVVHIEQLPRLDACIISHRHPDHFDLESLSHLDRGCLLICPDDHLVVALLQRMGFSRISVVRPGETYTLNDIRLFFTGSDVAYVKEFGVAFIADEGVIWNQVDTFPNERNLEELLVACGKVDLHLAKFASQNFSFFENRSVAFPIAEHAQNIATVLRVMPRVVAPSAGGFRFCGHHKWLNRFIFPVSPRQFLSDIESVSDRVGTSLFAPGDTFLVTQEEIKKVGGGDKFVSRGADNEESILFDPTSTIPPLSDPGADSSTLASLRDKIAQILEMDFLSYLQSPDFSCHRLAELYHSRRAQYVVGVVYPSGDEEFHSFGFAQSSVQHTYQAALPDWDVLHRIAATVLIDWASNRKSLFYVRAYSRRASRIYSLDRSPDGLRLAVENDADLLTMFFRAVSAAPSALPMAGSEEAMRTQCLTQCGLVCHKRPVN